MGKARLSLRVCAANLCQCVRISANVQGGKGKRMCGYQHILCMRALSASEGMHDFGKMARLCAGGPLLDNSSPVS